ncbi:MAG: hypothetical protein M1840_001820 [Geoglossum simile]|nr:MAG: hypothetical protein M1840_001820 [Geoglossum simile]
MARSQRDVKWVDGLRGIAAVFVATSHLARGFWPDLVLPPTRLAGNAPLFLYFPIIRLPGQGSAWLSIFFVISAYVNALKPIRQARAGNKSDAITTLATGSYRRTARFLLPSGFAMVFGWVLCELGLFSVAKVSEPGWLEDTTHAQDESLWGALRALKDSAMALWLRGEYPFEPSYWALFFLLKGSFIMFTVLLATICTRSRYRMLIMVLTYLFYWVGNDSMVGVSIVGGTILAEISLLPITAKYSHSPPRPCLTSLLPILGLLLGLLLSSYPENHPETALWSSSLARIGTLIIPSGADFWRFSTSLGAQLIILALIFSPLLQKPLSHPFVTWLGRISLPVYLLHGPLMRTVLVWMVFGVSVPPMDEDTDEEGLTFEYQPHIGLPGLPRIVLSIPAFLAILLFSAYLWTVYVDRWCDNIMKWIDRRVLGDDDVAVPVSGYEK